MPDLRIPIIHPNGTGREGLVRQYAHALEAVGKAQDALRATAPHSRDYYVDQDKNATVDAMDQHRARMAALSQVIDELAAIYFGVMDQ